MCRGPWESWVPGVLSKKQIKTLIEHGYMENCRRGVIDNSSIDLHLTNDGYLLTKGSVKPLGKPEYFTKLQEDKLVKKLEDNDGTFTLNTKTTYLFKIREKLAKTKALSGAKIYGQATAKSSVGRVDVLARLIVDGASSYDELDPDGLGCGNGEIFLEITPITFKVVVKEGISLSQLRLFLGSPDDAEIHECGIYRTCLKRENSEITDGTLSVDLTGVPISLKEVVSFLARDEEYGRLADPIKLWKSNGKKVNKHNPCDYWKFVTPNGSDSERRLMMENEAFYILRSKERIALPKNVAVYCKAIDETIGEMRINYAGFVHPLFGKSRPDTREGTPLIFEVRVHDTRVSLRDGEKFARLIFYRMSEDILCRKKAKDGDYNNQELQLSKFFDNWPDRIDVDEDGTVSPSDCVEAELV